MSLSTQPYKGTRDFYPEDMRLRKWMFNKWRKVVESFGYEEYDGPILEPLELYTAKTSEEIVNEQSFNFTDRGDRRVVMRPEMTPTVSRMVAARRQELGYPLRLYSIPNCFRYERQQRGRLREFWQLNVDLFGVEGIEAEFEMMLIINKLMEAFGATEDMYEIRVNSRKLLNKHIKQAGLKQNATITDVIKLVDKIDKIESSEFEQKLAELVKNTHDLLNFFTNDSATEEIKGLEEDLENAGVKNAQFVPTIARGFEYYTDIVFEVFDKDPENSRALFGGGRYDGLVGEFGVELVPTVGFGLGDVGFYNFLEIHNLLPNLKSDIDAYIVVIGDVLADAQRLAAELRSKGIKVAVDISGRKTDKQIANANKKNIPYKIFVGSEEVASQLYSVDGQEQKLNLDQILDLVATR